MASSALGGKNPKSASRGRRIGDARITAIFKNNKNINSTKQILLGSPCHI